MRPPFYWPFRWRVGPLSGLAQMKLRQALRALIAFSVWCGDRARGRPSCRLHWRSLKHANANRSPRSDAGHLKTAPRQVFRMQKQLATAIVQLLREFIARRLRERTTRVRARCWPPTRRKISMTNIAMRPRILIVCARVDLPCSEASCARCPRDAQHIRAMLD